MSLVARIRFRYGRYEAGGRDDRFPESVPSPYRLFNALVSVAARDGDVTENRSLSWLEHQPPPTILTPPILDGGSKSAFHVTNRIDKGGKSSRHLGRINNAKDRAWINFQGEIVEMVWRNDPSEEVLHGLQWLANRVTYVGRVESVASVAFELDDPDTAGKHVFEPVEIGGGDRLVAAPYPGSLRNLVENHRQHISAWQSAREFDYREQMSATASVVANQAPALLTYRIVGKGFAGEYALELANALRSAVMSRVAAITGKDGIPTAVHGHQTDIGHLGFVPLPVVGHPHADGHILGVAITLPQELTDSDRNVLAAALIDPNNPFGSVRYRRARNGVFRIQQSFADGDAPFAAQPQRWTGGSRGRRQWASATPMMVNHFPKREPLEDMVARALTQAGYPEPTNVEVSDYPFVTGGTPVRRLLWKGQLGNRPKRPLIHAKFEFATPVVGPVLAGATRYLGGGLSIPYRDIPAAADHGESWDVAVVAADSSISSGVDQEVPS